MEQQKRVVVTYGAGDNSTALIVEYVKRGLKIDRIVFSDTKGEKDSTYAYIPYFNEWLAKQGYPQIEIVTYNEEGLYNELIRRKSYPAIVFGFKSCSEKFKQRPFLKWVLANKEYLQPPFEKLIAYDIDEGHRLKGYQNKYWYDRYPLVEWEMDREDCIKSIESVGLRAPGKSSCFFCPSMRVFEIKDLQKTAPHLYRLAIALEENAAGMTSVKGLGRKKKWSDIVKQQTLDFAPPKISCECSAG